MTGLIRHRPEPLPGAMSDSDRNILASLRHDPCEAHCADCGCCIEYGDDMSQVGDDSFCLDCAPTGMTLLELHRRGELS